MEIVAENEDILGERFDVNNPEPLPPKKFIASTMPIGLCVDNLKTIRISDAGAFRLFGFHR
jgi:hypothetical protein